MPASRDRTLRVGLTVVVALAVIMAGTFLIGREQRFWGRKQSYEIRFTRINGLRVGSSVSLTGGDIGSVQDDSFPGDPNASFISIGGSHRIPSRWRGRQGRSARGSALRSSPRAPARTRRVPRRSR